MVNIKRKLQRLVLIIFLLSNLHNLFLRSSLHIYVYVIARAGVIFGIYFTSCRYSGG